MREALKLNFLLLAAVLGVACEVAPTTPTVTSDPRGSVVFGKDGRATKAIVRRPDFTLVGRGKLTASVMNTDYVAVGVGGLRNAGAGTIALSGVSGRVSKALLYWQGVTNSELLSTAPVTFAGRAITGTNIGISGDNCWSYANSQGFVADVSSAVTGNGSYSLSGFGTINPNGASLIVFFSDGSPLNNRDVLLFDGNDSNIGDVWDQSGWSATLGGIGYAGGTANLQLHIADGQSFMDDALLINGNVKIPISNWASGFTVPGANNGPSGNGRLWDIVNLRGGLTD